MKGEQIQISYRSAVWRSVFDCLRALKRFHTAWADSGRSFPLTVGQIWAQLQLTSTHRKLVILPVEVDQAARLFACSDRHYLADQDVMGTHLGDQAQAAIERHGGVFQKRAPEGPAAQCPAAKRSSMGVLPPNRLEMS